MLLALVVCCLACAGKPEEPPKDAKPKDTKAEKSEQNVGLGEYQLAKGPKRIKGVTNDASGLTYSPKTKSLFLVINGTSEIFELDLDGDSKRRIRTTGFVDLEGITHVRSETFCVVEEGRGTLCRITIGDRTKTISRGTAMVVTLDDDYLGNSGVEGVTYDSKGKRFFAVKEKNPRKIYEIIEPAPEPERGAAKVKKPWDIQKNNLGMSDLSGVYFHQKSGHLLILSHESRCLVEATLDGKEVSRLSLRGVTQAEGVTMDGEGTIYICSEPSVFYVYKKKK